MKAKYLIGGLVVVVFAALAFSALDESKLEYCSIDQAIDSGRKVQVKGTWVKDKGSDYNSHTNRFSFYMTDEQASVIKVVYEGARPNNFDLAESIVVKGRVQDGVLESDFILTKCPSKYEGGMEHADYEAPTPGA